MTQFQASFQNRREILAALGAAAAVLGACTRDGENAGAPKIAAKVFKMGERVPVGLITYNVLEAEYKTQLGGVAQKMPQKRFLVLRLAITNGGNKEAELPLFSLVDDKGETYAELQEGEGVANWLGLIRKIGPTMTEEGRILFDVMPRDYKLQVSDGEETSKEQLAHIEIPMQFDTAEPIPAAGQSPAAVSPRP